MSDTVLDINQSPFTGQALWQRIRWYAHTGDTITLAVRKQSGITLTSTILLNGYPAGYSVDDRPVRWTAPVEVLVLILVIFVPLFCLALGLWVAFARPFDPSAWLVLVLLTYPQAFNPGATRTWFRRGWRFGCTGTSAFNS